MAWAANHERLSKANVTVDTLNFNTRFSGQHFDSESGLHYNYFRDYDPEIGRYIQSDPIGQLFGPVDPQRLVIASLELGIPTGFSNVNHLYEYAHSNPILYTDFIGESPGTFVFIVVCGIGLQLNIQIEAGDD